MKTSITKVFGDDGFRCPYGQQYMTEDFLRAFAHGVVKYLRTTENKYPVLVGRDTRSTGPSIEDLICTVLSKAGIAVHTLGVVPTPGLSAVLASHSHLLGIMITASHDPAHYNGIKLFGPSGAKLDASVEQQLEKDILNFLELSRVPYEGKIAEVKAVPEHVEIYVQRLWAQLRDLKLSKRVLIDCAQGAASHLAHEAFGGLSGVSIAFDKPTGDNINTDCGALLPEKLLERVRNGRYDYGVAFDGDADRAIFVSQSYGIIETEKLTMLFSDLLNQKDNPCVIVSSEICNLGLEENCRIQNKTLVQSPVGDRSVVQAAELRQACLGVEPSGHYYFSQFAKTMDGPMACAMFLRLLDFYQENFQERLQSLAHYPRVKCDLPVRGDSEQMILGLTRVLRPRVHPLEEKLIIRRSIWDPVIRIYYDYKTTNRFELFKRLIREELTHEAQVVILAGGYGSRLKEVTGDDPKPMVRVYGIPFLEYILTWLRKQGFKKVLLLVGYRAEKIEAYFGSGHRWGLEITYSREVTPMGTAGALKMAEDLLEDKFLLVNGDTFLPIDYQEMWRSFIRADQKALVAAYNNNENVAAGNLKLDSKNQIVQYGTSEGDRDFVDAGAYVFKKEVFEKVDAEKITSLADIYPILISENQYHAFPIQQRYYDIGTPQRLGIFENFVSNFGEVRTKDAEL